MATPARFFETDGFYHVFNRGNRKQQIFLSKSDYERFLQKTITVKEKSPVKILAYCLMPNHFHFLLQQKAERSITNFISNLSNGYSKYFNIKYDTVGSLFQGRFKAIQVTSDEYLLHLSRYIHLNPVALFSNSENHIRNSLVNYPWSSLADYLRGSVSEIVDPTFILGYFPNKNKLKDYQEFVLSSIHLEIDPLIENFILE